MNSLTWTFVIGCTLLLFTAQRADSLKCYLCLGSGCEDEFDPDADGVMITSNCTGTCGKAKMGAIYTRACIDLENEDGCTEKDEQAICYCNTDLCNGSTNVAVSALVMGILTIMAFMFKKY